MNGFPHGKLKKNARVLKTQRKPEELGSVGGSIHRFLSVAQKP
jgi:preprotein translocase subunit Sss1